MSVFYSSAMTLRRGSFLYISAEIFHHWHRFRSSWLPTIWQHLGWITVIVLHDLQAVNPYPPCGGYWVTSPLRQYLTTEIGLQLTHHHRTNFDNENGNWYELYCQLFLLCLPSRELEWQSRLYGWLESGWSCTIFFVLPHLISLHVFDDDTVA